VQGSQPPVGYFNNANEMSPYDAARGDPNAGGYSAAQAWGNPYQASAADPTAAWAAYYQSYYGQTPGAQPVQAASAAAAAAAPGQPSSQPSINPQTGQPDYSQAWIEYYRSLGMHDQADAILRQTQQVYETFI
jgi:far upstream element-binding protein